MISDNRIEIVINQYALCYPETSLIPYGLNNCAFVSVLHSNPKLMLANFNDMNKLLARNKAERFVRILLNPLLRLRYYIKRARYYQWLSSNSDAVVLLSSGYRHQFKALGNAIAIPNPTVVETYGDFGEKEHIVLCYMSVGWIFLKKEWINFCVCGRAFKMIVEQKVGV